MDVRRSCFVSPQFVGVPSLVGQSAFSCPFFSRSHSLNTFPPSTTNHCPLNIFLSIMPNLQPPPHHPDSSPCTLFGWRRSSVRPLRYRFVVAFVGSKRITRDGRRRFSNRPISEQKLIAIFTGFFFFLVLWGFFCFVFFLNCLVCV